MVLYKLTLLFFNCGYCLCSLLTLSKKKKEKPMTVTTETSCLQTNILLYNYFVYSNENACSFKSDSSILNQ